MIKWSKESAIMKIEALEVKRQTWNKILIDLDYRTEKKSL